MNKNNESQKLISGNQYMMPGISVLTLNVRANILQGSGGENPHETDTEPTDFIYD